MTGKGPRNFSACRKTLKDQEGSVGRLNKVLKALLFIRCCHCFTYFSFLCNFSLLVEVAVYMREELNFGCYTFRVVLNIFTIQLTPLAKQKILVLIKQLKAKCTFYIVEIVMPTLIHIPHWQKPWPRENTDILGKEPLLIVGMSYLTILFAKNRWLKFAGYFCLQ